MDGELNFFSPATSISVRSTIGHNNGNTSKTVKNSLSSRSIESEKEKEKEKEKENVKKEKRGSISGKEKSMKDREDSKDDNDIDDIGVPSAPSYDTTGMYNNVNSVRRKSMENLRLKNLKMTPGEFSSVSWSELFLVGREDGTVDLFQVCFYFFLIFYLFIYLIILIFFY